MAKEKEGITVISEEQFQEQVTDELQQPVQPDSELKKLVVNYVGNKHGPESGEVTLEMVIETFADEFRDFLMPIAEENFIRGYQQALADIEEGEKFISDNPDILSVLQKENSEDV